MEQSFREEIVKLGVIRYEEQESLYSIARHCMKTMGIPAALGGAVIGAKAGTVTVPGVGTVSGSAVGFLSGLIGGPASCMIMNGALRQELHDLVKVSN